MLTIKIVCVGKLKEDYLKSAVKEYSKRLSKYCKLEIIELPDEKIPDKLNKSIENEIKEKECNNIIKHIKDDNFIISLDLNGKEYSSEEFSKELENISMVSSSITFVIGGSLGFSQNLLDMSKKRICFSKMTFPHQLIRVFLLEQLFRSFKIQNNEIYHR